MVPFSSITCWTVAPITRLNAGYWAASAARKSRNFACARIITYGNLARTRPKSAIVFSPSGVATEIAVEVAVGFQEGDGHPLAGEQVGEHDPGRPAADHDAVGRLCIDRFFVHFLYHPTSGIGFASPIVSGRQSGGGGTDIPIPVCAVSPPVGRTDRNVCATRVSRVPVGLEVSAYSHGGGGTDIPVCAVSPRVGRTDRNVCATRAICR